MLISLDYDDTYTVDPEFWQAVVALGIAHGHRFVCVTGRHEPPDPLREPPLPKGVPIVCTSGTPKYRAAKRKGYEVDVWIDDMPGTVDAPLWSPDDETEKEE